MDIKKVLRENLIYEKQLNESIEVYHGSVHSFEGFDLTNIGSGDGNDVHGYGLYFTDSEDVAYHYANVYQGREEKYIYSVKIFRTNFIEWDGYINESQATTILSRMKRKINDESELESLMDVLGLSESYYGEFPWVQSLYDYLTDVLGSKKATSEFLDLCGFDGISFQSKESGTNATNYVIFDKDNIKILDVKNV